MNRRIDPLDATERELADLLARDALPGPSPQLDARILAAARAAATPAQRRSQRRRWIAGIGIAASLVLAVGIAWRLRPLPQRAPAASEAQADMVRVSRSYEAGPAQAADAAASAPASAPVVEPAVVRGIEAPRPVREVAAPPPSESPVMFDEPAPMDTMAPPPSPAPPPAPPAFAPEPPAADAKAVAGAAPAAAEAAQPAQMQNRDKTLDRIDVTGSRINAAVAADAAADGGVVPSQAELDEEPPATADSPQVQDAWLQRIRDLLAAGQPEAARNSLVEFRRRYPKYTLPEDLRSLAKP